MNVPYKNTQHGYFVTTILVAVILVLCATYLLQTGDRPLPATPFVVLLLLFLAIVLTFYKLTVEISGNVLKLIYGIGLVSIKLNIEQLEQAEVIKTPWYYGLGIRIPPRGMLYNIQGSQAVRIVYMTKGKRKSVMVGTPEPAVLKAALEKHFTFKDNTKTTTGNLKNNRGVAKGKD